MILSTSVAELNRRTSRRYLFLTVFCCVFAAVYEAFSHHVFSAWMICLPLYPLILGTVLFFVLKKRIPNGWARQLWHCGTATLMMGSCLNGIFEIAGAKTQYTVYFLAAGIVFMAAAAVLLVFSLRSGRNTGRA